MDDLETPIFLKYNGPKKGLTFDGRQPNLRKLPTWKRFLRRMNRSSASWSKRPGAPSDISGGASRR